MRIPRQPAVTVLKCRVTAAVLACLTLGPATALGQDSGDVADLSAQATDPTASLMSFSLYGDYTASFHGASAGLPGDALVTAFRPVIPFTAFGQKNILRMTVPYQVSGRGEEELKDIALFDLVVFDRDWGRVGVGAVASFSTSDQAADEVAAGPAIGFVRPLSKGLNVGLFNQNLFAGDTAISQLQPIIAYQLAPGWSLSAGDLQLVYDWKAGRWLSLPLGIQLGKVTKLGSQPVRWYVNPQYNFADDHGLPGWSVKLGITLLVPAP